MQRLLTLAAGLRAHGLATCCRSLAQAAAPSLTGGKVLLTLLQPGGNCGAFANVDADVGLDSLQRKLDAARVRLAAKGK